MRSALRSSTTTGRPRPAGRSSRRSPGVEDTPRKFGSPSFPVYGYDVRLLHEGTGEEVGDGREGVLTIVPPLPPGCMTTVWGDDERFVNTYFSTFRTSSPTRRSTGRRATPTATTSCSAAPTT